MNRALRWSGVLCGLLTAMGCGGTESASMPEPRESRAAQMEALTAKDAASSWTTTSALAYPRNYQQAALLNSGLVLVAGGRAIYPGIGEYPSSNADLYNPYSNTWQSTGSLATPRYQFAATRLASGKVLVCGGWDYYDMLSGAEVYDPATGAWSFAGGMGDRRSNHRATLLQSGKVLVTGGSLEVRNGPDVTFPGATTAALYDPDANSWSSGGNVGHDTNGSLPVLLYSGEVMLLSGNRVDFYDPATNTWRQGPSMPGFGGSATRLYSGEVLVVGAGSEGNDTFLYNPYSGQWRSGPPTNEPHYLRPTATLLYSGEVLIAGGGATERYNPYTNTWTLLPNIPAAYQEASGVLLHTGQVMITGGSYFHSAAAILTP